MRSLQGKLLAAFLAVALVGVGVLGVLVGLATAGAFGEYLAGRSASDLASMAGMMDELMGRGASQAMLRQMYGPAEQAYLATVRSALLLAGILAALLALALGLVLSRQVTRPLRTLAQAARRLADGDLNQRVPVRSADELGELAAAFNTLAAALARQETLRRQMAADVAHELRTPLAVMQAELEALLDGVRPLSPAALTDIHEETRLLARLVADLRDLTLAEAGQLPLRRRPTALEALARASAGRFGARAENKGVRLAVTAEDGLPPADVDPDRIAQVLGNLLENALRHTPPGGTVDVRVARGGAPGTLRVLVRDSGPGIDKQHLANIFERFYRVDGARSRAAGGSGIGLAVVKHLVEAHGGRVCARSTPGMGATFGFLLPVHTEAGERDASQRRMAATMEGTSPCKEDTIDSRTTGTYTKVARERAS